MNKIDELEARCNEAAFDVAGQVAYIDVVDLYRLLAVVRAAERLTYKVLAQREIQDDELSELPISELKDTLGRLEGGE